MLIREKDRERSPKPVAKSFLHGGQLSGKEMVGVRNKNQLFRFRGCGDDIAKLVRGRELVATAAEEELGDRAGRKHGITIVAALSFSRKTEGSEAANLGVAAAGGKPHGCSKGETGDDDGLVVVQGEPVQGRFHVFGFSAAVMLAFAQASAAKVEAQNRAAKAMKDFGGMVDDLVVHGSAPEGVWVTDQTDELRARMAFIQYRFESPRRTLEFEGADGLCPSRRFRLVSRGESGLSLRFV